MTPSTAPLTLYQKLVNAHTVAVLDAQNILLFCDLHLMNEYTSPQAFAGAARTRARRGHAGPERGPRSATSSRRTRCGTA